MANDNNKNRKVLAEDSATIVSPVAIQTQQDRINALLKQAQQVKQQTNNSGQK